MKSNADSLRGEELDLGKVIVEGDVGHVLENLLAKVRVVLILAIPMLLFLNIPKAHSQAGLWGWRVLGLAIVVGAGVWHIIVTYVLPLKRSHQWRNLGELPGTMPAMLQKQAGREEEVTLKRAMFFATAIVAPTQIFRRIIDEYEPGYKTLQRKVTLELQIDDYLLTDDSSNGLDNIALVPIIVSPKSVLHDNLVVSNASGEVLPTLSYREYLELAARVLRILVTNAYDPNSQDSQNDLKNLRKAEKSALAEIARRRNDTLSLSTEAIQRKKTKLLSTICNYSFEGKRAADGTTTYTPHSLKGLKDHVEEVIKSLERVPIEKRDPATSLHLAADFTRELAEKYAVVVPVRVPENGRLVLQYSQTVSPIRTKINGKRRSLVGKIRAFLGIALGARPIAVNLRLETAGKCQSFHLSVVAPEGYYLGSQGIDEGYSSYFEQLAPEAPTLPYIRYRARLGQRYAHIYGRNFSRATDSSDTPIIRFAFNETPPGSDFRAAAAALSAAFLIGLIGFSFSQVTGLKPPETVSDAPLLLLAFPGAVAGWLGLDAATTNLFDSSLAARISLILTVVASVAASALFIINKSFIEPNYFDQQMPDHISLLGINKLSWAVVTACAVMNALCISYVFLVKSWQFSHLASVDRMGEL